MSFINRDVFVERLQSDDNLRWKARRNGVTPFLVPDNPAVIPRKNALRVLREMREYAASRGSFYGKDLRPWVEDPNLYSRLDRSQTWVGFEYEAGYSSHEARAAVIRHTWNKWDNVVFDSEGEGGYPSEITFAPVELSKFEDGTAPFYQFMEYIGRHKDRMVTGSNNAFVGTHVNLSWEEMDSDLQQSHVNNSLNRLLLYLPRNVTIDGREHNTRKYLFGRSRMYNGFFSRRHGRARWIEGKLFRSVYSIEEFKHYLKVVKALDAVARTILNTTSSSVDALRTGLPGVRVVDSVCLNFMDVVLEGAEPVLGEPEALYNNINAEGERYYTGYRQSNQRLLSEILTEEQQQEVLAYASTASGREGQPLVAVPTIYDMHPAYVLAGRFVFPRYHNGSREEETALNRLINSINTTPGVEAVLVRDIPVNPPVIRLEENA